jgi:hypothetical protein
VVEHSTHDLQVDGSNPAAGTSSGRTVVGVQGHLTDDPKIKGLSTPAPCCHLERENGKNSKKCVYGFVKVGLKVA